MNTNTFIKVPNGVIGNIKSLNCYVYLYLLYLCTVQNSCSVKVKHETIRNFTGIKFAETVCDMTHRLQKQGYLKIENNHNPITGLQTCNTITVLDYDPQQDYFLFPAEYLSAGLPGYALELLLTLYMFSFQDSFCIPSFTQITQASRLSPASIVKGYKVLEEKGIIIKENHRQKEDSKGRNRYFLVKRVKRTNKRKKLVPDDLAAFKARIDYEKRLRRITNADIAHMTGFSKSAVDKFMNNDKSRNSWRIGAAIAGVLGLSDHLHEEID